MKKCLESCLPLPQVTPQASRAEEEMRLVEHLAGKCVASHWSQAWEEGTRWELGSRGVWNTTAEFGWAGGPLWDSQGEGDTEPEDV